MVSGRAKERLHVSEPTECYNVASWVAEQATGIALPWLDFTIGVHALSFHQLQARYGAEVVQ